LAPEVIFRLSSLELDSKQQASHSNNTSPALSQTPTSGAIGATGEQLCEVLGLLDLDNADDNGGVGSEKKELDVDEMEGCKGSEVQGDVSGLASGDVSPSDPHEPDAPNDQNSLTTQSAEGEEHTEKEREREAVVVVVGSSGPGELEKEEAKDTTGMYGSYTRITRITRITQITQITRITIQWRWRMRKRTIRRAV